MKITLKSILLFCALFTATGAWAVNENYINKVGGWTECGAPSGSWRNFAGVTKGGVALQEWYGAAHPAAGTVIMKQTIEGLPAGYYTVELYANGSLANIGAAEGGGNGALNRTYIYANTTEQTIPVVHQNDVATPTLWVLDTQVGSDGKMEIGVKCAQQGANWYLIAVKSIKYRGTEAVAKPTNSGTWWSKQKNGAPGGYTSHQGAMKENYFGNYQTGKQLTQTITGLTPGYYHVGVYATASWTGSRDTGLGSQPGGNNATDRTYVYAGNDDANIKEYIPVISQTGVSVPGVYDLYNVKVGNDGNMEIGIFNEQNGSNWQVMSVKDIQYLGTNPDYSHKIGENQSDWQGANGMVGWASCIKMVENYQNSQVVGSALMTRQITDLPVGLYTLKLYCNANRANGVGDPLPSEGVENTALVVTGAGEPMTQMVKVYSTNSYASVADMQLFTFEDIEVDDAGTIDIALGNAVAGANWFTIAGESLVWTGVSLKLLQSSLQNAVDAASLRTEEFMSTATRTALTSAISAAQTVLDDEDATEEQLNTALTDVQAAVAAIDTWKADWAAAKAPLIAAMERFEADYNDGQNGALRKMSAEAWNTLVTAAGVAATAKDQYEDLTALGTAATTFNAAMDAAEQSIALYGKYELLMAALNRYNSTAFPKATYDTEAYHASDATVTAAIAAMNTAWETYKATLSGNQNVTVLAGENMDFETPQGEQLVQGNQRGIYEQPGWTVAYANNENFSLETTTDVPTGTSGTHSLKVYANWGGELMQAKQSTVLPAGNYNLSMAVKMPNKNWNNNMTYVEIGGTRNTINVGSDWETVSYDLELTEPTLVTISIGHDSWAGDRKREVFVDDITLTLYNKTTYERYHETATTMKDGGSASLALASALAQYTEATETGATSAGYDIEVATGVLRNAVAMAEASDNATSLIANPQFADGTTGWTHYETITGYNDVSVKTDGSLKQFNVWGDRIMYSDLYQQVLNLPNGTYELTANFQTYTAENRKTVGNGKRSADGYSWISLYGHNFDTAEGASATMRSNNIGHGEGLEDDARHDYTVYFTVVNNKANIGVRSDYTYYRVTDFRLRMVDAAEHKADVAKGIIYDALFNPEAASNLEYDLTAAKYADAENVDLRTGGFVQQPNALIKAANAGQIAGNNVLVDVDGELVCENLVITDKAPFQSNSTFTAENATYERDMTTEWGTVMLPYAVQSDDAVKYYTLKKVETGENGCM